MTQQLITAITNDNIIDIRFKAMWYQEDIPQLATLIFAKLPNVNIIEKQLGADRETYRLNFDTNYLILNFDYYSQSCWLEPESVNDDSIQYIELLNSALILK